MMTCMQLVRTLQLNYFSTEYSGKHLGETSERLALKYVHDAPFSSIHSPKQT